MADQLAFDWPTGVALGPDDFFVSQANAQAFSMLSAPETWPDGKLALIGPAGCGKSHLARVFQAQTDALCVKAKQVSADFHTDANTIILEDMEDLPTQSEEAVFHLHNKLRHTAGMLLLTAQTPPSRWPIALADLASRMQAATVVQIANPDDALLSALLMKLFADRQIMPKSALVAYLTSRIERSFAAAADIVIQLDAAALAQNRKIDIPLARALLDKPG